MFSISICRNSNGTGTRHKERVLKGHTRDISAHGLALDLPQMNLDGHHLAAEERELRLKLELPGGPTSMVVVPRRYERLDETELGYSYRLGVRIVQISDEDLQRYSSFITQGLAEKRLTAT
jgi:hypothetical protein